MVNAIDNKRGCNWVRFGIESFNSIEEVSNRFVNVKVFEDMMGVVSYL